MLDRALDARGVSLDSIPGPALDRYLAEAKFKRLEELLADIALGNRMPDQVAEQLAQARGAPDAQALNRSAEKILINGSERGVLSFGNCCNPVPGDDIVGYLSSGKGIVVHRQDCPNLPEYKKTPERIVPIGWDREVSGDYRARLRIVVDNKPGVLATVAAAIAEGDSNIENVEYQERDLQTSSLLFTIEVRNRKHLADVMRRVRRASVVHGV